MNLRAELGRVLSRELYSERVLHDCGRYITPTWILVAALTWLWTDSIKASVAAALAAFALGSIIGGTWHYRCMIRWDARHQNGCEHTAKPEANT